MSEKDEARVVQAVQKQLFIDGKWQEASDGRTFDVTDPATGKTLCPVADASEEDGRAALDAAVAAQPDFAAPRRANGRISFPARSSCCMRGSRTSHC